MNYPTSDKENESCCVSKHAPANCCQTPADSSSACCAPEERSWKNKKTLLSVIIILAAMGVGANSFFNGNSAQSYTTVPAKSFSAGLTQVPTVTTENSSQGTPQTKQGDISLDGVLDSLQSLDTLAADKDVVFLVLTGGTQLTPPVVPKQLESVANNLWKNGQRIAVFTVKTSSSGHDQLVRHFSVKAFPSVVILGRQGSASVVEADMTEAGLYNAFVLASKAMSCCPTQGNASCCPE